MLRAPLPPFTVETECRRCGWPRTRGIRAIPTGLRRAKFCQTSMRTSGSLGTDSQGCSLNARFRKQDKKGSNYLR
jgi:hypothetical protein